MPKIEVILVCVPILRGHKRGDRVPVETAPEELLYWAETGSKTGSGETIAIFETEPEPVIEEPIEEPEPVKPDFNGHKRERKNK